MIFRLRNHQSRAVSENFCPTHYSPQCITRHDRPSFTRTMAVCMMQRISRRYCAHWAHRSHTLRPVVRRRMGIRSRSTGISNSTLVIPDRFATLVEPVCETYRTIYVYNNSRFHTALKMSPREFAQMHKPGTIKTLEASVQ